MIKNFTFKKIFKYYITIFLFFIFNFAYGETIEVTERKIFGPGPFPDQTLDVAWIRKLEFDTFLNGVVEGANNLGDEPNVSGEALQGKTIDGMLSDETLINENIDMGNVVIMNGQFNLLLAAIYSDANQGNTYFYTDDDLNWWIKDDIGIDPGFAAGIIKIENFTFSTSPRIIPSSIQKEKGYPGGTEAIGSTSSGRVAIGRLGDDDQDGYLDGTFNAIGQFPMKAIFLPGAPFVQSFGFKSDIEVNSVEASLLTIANARSYLKLLDETRQLEPAHQDLKILFDEAVDRTRLAELHLSNSIKNDSCTTDCQALIPIKEKLNEVLSELKQARPTAKNMTSKIDDVFKELKNMNLMRSV